MLSSRFVINGWVAVVAAGGLLAGGLAEAGPAAATSRAAAASQPGTASGGPRVAGLQQALNRLVAMPSGPPGVLLIVQHGRSRRVYRAGTAVLGRHQPPAAADQARLASVSKAFSGAVVLALVSRGQLRLTDTIGRRLPWFPRAWHPVTVAELLQHRSGLPDFTSSPALARRLQRFPRRPIPPGQLLRYVWHQPLRFPPGSRYVYDNSDNVAAAMMARAVTGHSYRALLRTLVYAPAGLRHVSLPAAVRLPRPYLHGYDLVPGHPPEDVSEALTPSAAWASGGMVATPAELNQFIRAYLGGRFFTPGVQAAQLRFVPGRSDPPGPGGNAAGLAVFRYRTRCGTVYGHTGNFPGYTQFAAATRGGLDSVTATASEQLNLRQHPAVLVAWRHAELLAVCAALGRR
jgi:D-alanyl-D-alanine carboxypeptidase